MKSVKVLSTYSLDIPSLSQFDNDEHINLYYDQNKYRGHLMKQLKNRNINLIGVNVEGGRFHSKFVIDENEVYIRSANLSLKEAKSCLNFSVGPFQLPKEFKPDRSNLLIFQNGKLLTCKNELPLNSIIKWIKNHRKFLGGDLNVKITIASPDFISSKVLSLINFELKDLNYELYTFTNSECLIKNAIKHISFVPSESFKLHGKLFYIQIGNNSLLYVGSSNFTEKGFISGNIETGAMFFEAAGNSNSARIQELLKGDWRISKTLTEELPESEDVEPDDSEFGDFEDYLNTQEANEAIDVNFEKMMVSIRIKKRGYRFSVGASETFETAIKVRWHQRLSVRVYKNKNLIDEIPIRPESTELIEGMLDLESIFTIYAGSKGKKRKGNSSLGKDESLKYVKTRVSIPWEKVKDLKLSILAYENLKSELHETIDLERRILILNLIAILEYHQKMEVDGGGTNA